MEIDWSKAPEGATHYGPESESFCEAWYRVEDGTVIEYVPADFPVPLILMDAAQGKGFYHGTDDLIAIWKGEGIPPVGTVCGLWFKGTDQGEVTVLFIGDEVGVFKSHAFGHEQHSDLVHYQYYLINNTPEEAEAQSRKKAIAEMTTTAGGQYSPRDSIVQRLYDAGYRKQAKP